MNSVSNNYLLAAAFCCVLAAFAHVGCIVFGGDWYRTIVTSAIVVILLSFALYALAGSGTIKRLSFTRLALVITSSIFLLRGGAFVGLMPMFPDNSLTFWLVSSGICLILGGLFAVGTVQQWPALGGIHV